VIVGALLGFMIVFCSVLVMEYFDDTLKDPTKAARKLKLSFLGVLPKIMMETRKINLTLITNRLLEIALQKAEMFLEVHYSGKTTKTLLFFSTLSKEGKSVAAGNMARKLMQLGDKVILLDYSSESLRNYEIIQTGDPKAVLPELVTGKVKQKKRASLINMLLGYPDNRVDQDNAFLTPPEKYLGDGNYFQYKVDEGFFSAKNYQEILEQNGIVLSYKPDYVMIELPPILFYPYPVGLLEDADLPVLVCRSNRIWTEADQAVLDVLMKLTKQAPQFILNGVELLVIESVLGELPRKRTWLRRKLKNIFRFQFFSRNQF
jgi:hypothetical protein